ncbi:MAG: hypothetical protein WBK48_06645 [Dethiobacteria bacterium]|nr:hypothetical protein [Bacillota bacterium]HOP70023.1 hypothetical protein [Bacillota bacterium]HPT34506.1 hypothetical protein [Bacillota bacterium]HQD06067.1 hypothetical protein [Bacillota bacterium]
MTVSRYAKVLGAVLLLVIGTLFVTSIYGYGPEHLEAGVQQENDLEVLLLNISLLVTAIEHKTIQNAPIITAAFFCSVLLGTATVIYKNNGRREAGASAREEKSAPKTRPFGYIYGLPGLLSWAVILFCAVGLIAFPRVIFSIAFIFLVFLLLRMALITLFNIVGSIRCLFWERRDWDADAQVVRVSAGFAPADVYHIVLLPNFKESPKVLKRTLDALAVQSRAATRLIPVLAMEAREQGSLEKGEALAREYADKFCRILVTLHPAGLPGELPCKSANMTYAVQEAWRVVVEEMGIPPERVTVSSCDADSVFHPRYFAALSRLFVDDPQRYNRFWQAPLLYYNNLWQTYAPIRLMTYFSHTSQMGELALPFYVPLPISTYSLSLRLAREIGWWDPAVISEDWHVFIKTFLLKKGKISLTPVFLPTRSDAIDGENFWTAMHNRYQQVTRHSWGAEDVGYFLSRWTTSRGIPLFKKSFRFLQVLIDHLLRSTAWFVLFSGSVAAAGLRQGNIVPPGFESIEPLARVIYLVGFFSLILLVAVEFIRFPPPGVTAFFTKLATTLVAWLLLPIFSLFLLALPALKAQTMLLMGVPLAYWVTPRNVSSRG